jgi:heterodisulfide reductase subunit C
MIKGDEPAQPHAQRARRWRSCGARSSHCPAACGTRYAFRPIVSARAGAQARRGERDRFFWYCEKCHAELYEAVRHVADYREDPVSRVYEEFYSEEARRSCGKCGHVTARPAG